MSDTHCEHHLSHRPVLAFLTGMNQRLEDDVECWEATLTGPRGSIEVGIIDPACSSARAGEFVDWENPNRGVDFDRVQEASGVPMHAARQELEEMCSYLLSTC